jgi:hypothetical protein
MGAIMEESILMQAMVMPMTLISIIQTKILIIFPLYLTQDILHLQVKLEDLKILQELYQKFDFKYYNLYNLL